jgi:hypothetical protein
MKTLPLICFLFAPIAALAQKDSSISVLDFVRIKNGNKAEALYFYDHNWRTYREIALKKGYIQSYTLLTTVPDSVANFDLILVTVYKDSVQYGNSEKQFNDIIKETRPGGPQLIDDLKPGDFRVNMFSKVAKGLPQ